MSGNESSGWSWEQDKQFENALVMYPEDSKDRWERIAADVGTSVEEVKHHYEILVDDINRIESGLVEMPCYNDCSSSRSGDDATKKKGGRSRHLNTGSNKERRKTIYWTADEHRLFLIGLEKYGKGQWRSISKFSVVTKNPTQVASHAQKYFARLKISNNKRRRSSIHDITTVNIGDIAPVPIMGHTNGFAVGGAKSNKHVPQTNWTPTNTNGTPTNEQPIGGTAVGPHINFPPPLLQACGVLAPVPGAPLSMAPAAYQRQVPHLTSIARPYQA